MISWTFEPSGAAHLLHRVGKEIIAPKDIRVFGEKTKDEPGHEVVHLFPAFGGGPVGIVAQQFEGRAC